MDDDSTFKLSLYKIDFPIQETELQPGDHIYTGKIAYKYHGIYMGDRKVIYYGQGGNKIITAINSFSSFLKSGSHCGNCNSNLRPGGVNKCCLDCFLSGGDVCRYRYGVKHRVFFIRKAGTCTLAESDSIAAVLHRANYLFQHNGFGKYDVLGRNSEHFALYCKTSMILEDISSQALSKVTTVVSFLSSPLHLGLADPILRNGLRYFADPGVTDDVRKVEVEKLVKEVASMNQRVG